MTFIEFFDDTAVENICTCLTYNPSRIIYIGEDSNKIKEHISNYEKVFNGRGYKVEILLRTVLKNDLQDAIRTLSEIVETYEECTFDITGGDEILNLALGVVYEKYPDKNIQIHKFNITSNAIYDCDHGGVTICRDVPIISVEENIRIYGGEINSADTYNWELDPEFKKDVNLIWDVCRENPRFWNIQIGVLDAAEKVGKFSEDGLTVILRQMDLENYLLQNNSRYKLSKGIIRNLSDNGLLFYKENRKKDLIKISYKNKQVRKCLTKAGLALEMKVYCIAMDLTDTEGKAVYNDARNGVVIDWDGEQEKGMGACNTENEIDVMLMRNMVPIFISCKNGRVSTEELYKLNTVSERFGGDYAKRVLIMSSSVMDGEGGEYFRQRARDMNINLIENAQGLEDKEFEDEIRGL